jgi:hypothetical protein
VLIRAICSAAFILWLAACASGGAAGPGVEGVDLNEPRRVVGTERSVRIDAQISAEEIRPGGSVPVTWTITNDRPTAIAIADLVTETSWDGEAHLFTVTIGSEVPGNELLPRLIEIAPGGRRTFNGVARLTLVGARRAFDPLQAGLRLKLNFLGDVAPFRQLVGIEENALADAKLADALFPLWLERNEVVYTNAVPMRWETRPAELRPDASQGRRRRM